MGGGSRLARLPDACGEDGIDADDAAPSSTLDQPLDGIEDRGDCGSAATVAFAVGTATGGGGGARVA